MESKKQKKNSNVVTLQNKEGFSSIVKKVMKKPGIKRASGPVRIGVSEPGEGWRCKICSYLNNNEEELCKMCNEEKIVMKENFVEKKSLKK